MNATNGGRPQVPGPPTVPNWPLSLGSERRADRERFELDSVSVAPGAASPFRTALGTTATGLGEFPSCVPNRHRPAPPPAMAGRP